MFGLLSMEEKDLTSSMDSTVLLNDGTVMPLIGFGTYLMNSEEVLRCVPTAIASGYKMIDTAQGYKTEADVGTALKSLTQPKVYIMTKLWSGMEPGEVGYEDTIRCCEESRRKLQVDSIDMYIIHAPFAGTEGRLSQWKALVDMRNKGFCRSIGVSNYSIKHLEEIRNAGLPLPAINQLEVHPYCQHRDIVTYCQQHRIVVVAYSSLAPLSAWRPNQKSAKQALPEDSPLRQENPIFNDFARKYQVKESQLLLKWALQKGYVILPKSVAPERISDNIMLGHFNISEEDMDTLDSLDQNTSFAWPIGDPCEAE